MKIGKNPGGYGFCWPRDMYYPLKVNLLLGNYNIVNNYYKKFIPNIIEKGGKIGQRFYLNGEIAPSWGYQIDEIATNIISYFNYFNNLSEVLNIPEFNDKTVKLNEYINKNNRNLKLNELFLESIDDILKQINYIIKYINIIKKDKNSLINKEKEIFNTFDLWENFVGINTYSLGSIYKSIDCFEKFISKNYKFLNKENKVKFEEITKNYSNKGLKKLKQDIKEYIKNNLYNEYKNSFVNNDEQNYIDISTIKLFTDFEVFSPKEKESLNTINQIENVLKRNYGYLRYENDNYIGGNWSLSSLNLVEYYLKTNDITNIQKIKSNLDYIINSVNNLNLISEQIDITVNKGIWINGLIWAHCQYISIINDIINNDSNIEF